MARVWAAVGFWVLLALGCGARTELLIDSDTGAENAGGAPLQMHCELEGNDARVAGIKPDERATLDGADFVVGQVKSYRWKLQ